MQSRWWGYRAAAGALCVCSPLLSRLGHEADSAVRQGIDRRKDPLVSKLEWTDLDQRAVDTARVLAMDAGRKLIEGDPHDVMSSRAVREVYLGTDPEAA